MGRILQGVAVLGLLLVVVLAVIPMSPLPFVPINVHWPNGSTREVRTLADSYLPPPPSLTFADVVIRRGWDTPYMECLYYRGHDDADEVLTYYRVLLQQHGWVRQYERGGEDRFRVFTIAPSRDVGGPSIIFVTERGTFYHGTEEGDYRVQLCSTSWKATAERMP